MKDKKSEAAKVIKKKHPSYIVEIQYRNSSICLENILGSVEMIQGSAGEVGWDLYIKRIVCFRFWNLF